MWRDYDNGLSSYAQIDGYDVHVVRAIRWKAVITHLLSPGRGRYDGELVALASKDAAQQAAEAWVADHPLSARKAQ